MVDTPTPVAAPAPVKAKVVPFEGRAPCYWVIIQKEDGSITATNDETGEAFEGSIKEFNARLRG
jgi:hypothetical protein